MSRQLEIDFSAGDEPRKLIRARIQDLVTTSMNESTSGVAMPGKISDTEPNEINNTAEAKKRRYTVSSLF